MPKFDCGCVMRVHETTSWISSRVDPTFGVHVWVESMGKCHRDQDHLSSIKHRFCSLIFILFIS